MNNAALYERANALQRRDCEATLAEFAPRMKWKSSSTTAAAAAAVSADVEMVLDIGCGSGDFTAGVLAPTATRMASNEGKIHEVSEQEVGKVAGKLSGLFGKLNHKNSGNDKNHVQRKSSNENVESLDFVRIVGVDISNEMVEHAKTRLVTNDFTYYF